MTKRLVTTAAFVVAVAIQPFPASHADAPATPSVNVESVVSAGSDNACVIKAFPTSSFQCWGEGQFQSLEIPGDLGVPAQVSAGHAHVCVVNRSDSKVRCWGYRDGRERVPADLGPVKSIDAGNGSTCAITVASELVCWYADGWPVSRAIPESVRNAKEVQSSVGMFGWGTGTLFCAVSMDDRAVCWNFLEELTVPSDLGRVRGIAVGGRHACAIRLSDSTVACWGSGAGVSVPDNLGPVSQVVAGSYFSCAITTDTSRLRCWGDGAAASVPTLDGVESVSARHNYICATFTDSPAFKCWGELFIQYWQSPMSSSLNLTEPGRPRNIITTAGNGQVRVDWTPPANDGSSEITQYRVTLNPANGQCVTTANNCTIAGLRNQIKYEVTVSAINAIGEGPPSRSHSTVIPLAPDFQVWSEDTVLPIGSSTTLRVAQAAAGASIAVTGSAKVTLAADGQGYASIALSASKAGIHKFTATYSVKVGKKLTKYTATTQLYVPSVMGPMLKIKQGKTGKFSLQFMPPGAAVAIALSDGRTLTGIADSAGKSSFTPTFNTLGAVTYTASVAGVQIGTGGLTVTK